MLATYVSIQVVEWLLGTLQGQESFSGCFLTRGLKCWAKEERGQVSFVSIYSSLYLAIHPPTHIASQPVIHLSTHPRPNHPLNHPSIHPSVCPPTHIRAPMRTCTHPSTCWAICPFPIHPTIHTHPSIQHILRHSLCAKSYVTIPPLGSSNLGLPLWLSW